MVISYRWGVVGGWLAHVILVSVPVPVVLWILYNFGFGIGSRGTRIGTRASQFLKISYSLIQAYFEPCSTKYIHAVRSFDI